MSIKDNMVAGFLLFLGLIGAVVADNEAPECSRYSLQVRFYVFETNNIGEKILIRQSAQNLSGVLCIRILASFSRSYFISG